MKTKIKNICITSENRNNYKYIIVRECGNDLWFYDFSNDLQSASRICREIQNGLVYELDQVIGENE